MCRWSIFHRDPHPDVVVEMDASDTGLITLVPSDRCVLSYAISAEEHQLMAVTTIDPTVGFDIKYRELLSCAFAVQAWGSLWRTTSAPPVHVQFKSDNTSAVAWYNKMASCNTQAQTVILLLGHWELELVLRFSAVRVTGVENRIADAGFGTNSSTAMAALSNRLTLGWLQERSGHELLCPVFGVLCLLRAYRGLPVDIPVAVFIT